MDGLHKGKVEVEMLRQHILASTLIHDDESDSSSCRSCNRSGLLDKLSQLEDKIDSAVECILDEWKLLKVHYEAAESMKEKAISSYEITLLKLRYSEEKNRLLQERCNQSEEKIQCMELKIHELQDDVIISNKQADSFANEVVHLNSTLNKKESKFRRKNIELVRVVKQVNNINEQKYKLEANIELLVDDYRNATERIVDLEDALDQTALCQNDVSIKQHNVLRLKEENEALMRQIDILKDENESLLGESEDAVGELKSNGSLLGEQSLSDNETSSLEQSNEQEELTVRVEELQSQVEVMFNREKMLLEMNMLLESGQEVSIELAKKELQMANETLREELETLKKSYYIEKAKMQSDLSNRTFQEDRLKNAFKKEITLLKENIHKMNAEKSTAETKLRELESMIEEQQVELEQNDVLITGLRTEKEDYRSEFLIMQGKVDQAEKWLHESLSFAASPPPKSSLRKSCANPQSPKRYYGNEPP